MEVFIEPVLPRPELLIVGHGRIAETLAALGSLMGFSISINDPGAERKAFPQADRIVTDDLDLTETPIGSRTFVVIATQHKRDHLWLEKALQSEARYVALIASQHRSKLVLDYLRSTAVKEEKIRSVFAPAGLNLGAATPEEIALSVISQMVAVRRGAGPGALAGDLRRSEPNEDSVKRECDTDVRV
jgi:xanthine dehydrogenase accessory factor